MSKEHLTQSEIHLDPASQILKSKNKVDINDLLKNVRNQKKKENKENFIFLGLVCSVVAITGVIASL